MEVQTVSKEATDHPIEGAEEWKSRPQLSLLIENIPSHWMVADLKRFLDGFGNVVKVEIFENRLVRLTSRFSGPADFRRERTVAVGKHSTGELSHNLGRV
jgi:hypothetical protein